MAAGGAHHALSIDEMLVSLGSTPINQECCIFKVHHRLREINAQAYEPDLLAIGPYHHGKGHLSFMEEHKLRFLQGMLKRMNEITAERYIRVMREKVGRARRFYADQFPDLSTDKYAEMMLLDGCFIIELFRKSRMRDPENKDDPIFQLDWMLAGITRDLMLFENQLPYFVLTELFEMSASNQTPDLESSGHSGEHTCEIESSSSENQSVQTRLDNLATSFFSVLFPFRDLDVNGSIPYSIEDTKHILCQPQKALTPPLAKMLHEHQEVRCKFKKADFKHLLDLIHTIIRLLVLDVELHRAIESQKVGLIHRVVCPLLAKMEKMKNGYEKVNEDDDSNEVWKIPCGTDLPDVRVELEVMVKKLIDKSNYWKSIPDAIAFQEAGIEFEEARRILWDPLVQNRNDEDKSELCGAKSKLVERFMSLLCLNQNENWDSIPHGTKLRKAKVEFKKAEKFRDTKDMMKPIPNATEVREAGVKFKAEQRTMFAINFCNGVLEISPLIIDEITETFLHNFIAHEQYSPYNDSNFVTDYVRIFDDLIDSAKDVTLLRRKGIIENCLGTDEVASAMINKLCKQVVFSTNSIYHRTSIDMNRHCSNSCNVWMAMLWHKYFDSPWALISAVAAFLLLVLAIIQTIYSIIN